MEVMARIQRITPSANKKQITTLFSTLGQIDKGAIMMNVLLQSNDYDRRRSESLYRSVADLTARSPLDTSVVINPWKEKFHKLFYFVTFPGT
ncbi:hypothetical protein TNCV_4749471 [Trichonephila clavipes]|nr:hypothetical protein TNCV_4749471 [Trichonephila clavipes]